MMLKGFYDVKNLLYGLNIYPLILDGLIIFIIIYNIIKSAKQGFVSSLVSLVLTVIMWVFIWPFSDGVSNNIYNLYLRDNLSNMVEKKLVNKGIEDIDMFIKMFEQSFLDMGKLFNLPNIDTLESLNNISYVITDKIIYPVFHIVMCVILLIIFSFIFSVLLKILRKLFSKFSYIPVLGKINIILGGVFGFLKSIVIVAFLAVIINNLILFSGDSWSFLNSDIKKSSYLLSFYDKFINIEKDFNFFK